MKHLLLAFIVLSLFSQCQVEERTETKSSELDKVMVIDTMNEEVLNVNKIELFKITQEAFPDAILELNVPNENQNYKESEKVKFNFNAVNFRFENGASVALWMPNTPVQRIDKADFEIKINKGNYTALAYLCDEQELSIKQPEAYVLRSFSVGKQSKSANETDSVFVILNNPTSKPTSSPIIDFYLANTNISKSGNKLKLWIDNNEFQLHNWSAYKVNGLPKGKHKVKIMLVNPKGDKINSAFATDSTEIVVD